MPEMISVEQARDLVLSHVSQLPAETVPVLDAAGRVAAVDLKSDIDISPFAHAAMDGFAMRAAQLQSASPESPSSWTLSRRLPPETPSRATSPRAHACAS